MADRTLDGQVALVTGATRGIGRAIAQALAQRRRHGGRHRDHRRGRGERSPRTSPRPAIAGTGLRSTSPTARPSTRRSPTSRRASAPIAILVNNAGITRDNLLLRMKDDEWDAVMATNLKAAFRLAKGVLRGMMKARHGRIIQIGSVVGTSGNPGQANYAAAKAALVGFTKSLAQEVGSRNITVNCVAPGFIDTDMTQALPEAQRAKLLEKIPLGRLGSPRTSRMRSRSWPRRRPATSPAPRCTSTAACTWPEDAPEPESPDLSICHLVKSCSFNQTLPHWEGEAWKTSKNESRRSLPSNWA